MANPPRLNDPSLVAVWPGMGHVALNAGVYLLAKLHMGVFAEFEAADLFDADHVLVRQGLILPPKPPRNRFFAWHDPAGERDLVVFLGEAQPPIGGRPFCRQLVRFARQLGVERVYTFASMATAMRPEHPSRVFAAATDADSLARLRNLDADLLEDGRITGLNGVLLGVAAEEGLPGACLLGEIPQVFAQFPFPKASLAVLETFASLAKLEIDLTELAEQARASEENLGTLLARVEAVAEGAMSDDDSAEDEDAETFPPPPAEDEPPLARDDERRIESLFAEAATDRSKAFVLKRELDRLEVFDEFEDRFLDLFKKPERAAEPGDARYSAADRMSQGHVVLLGDSIFDNARYVPGEPPVVRQVEDLLPGGWRATLLAVDGHVTRDVARQATRLPADASHIFVSVGGNDALGESQFVRRPASSVAGVMTELRAIQERFRDDYRAMLRAVLGHGRPTAVCTIYDSIPGLAQPAVTALGAFNEVILRESFRLGLPVIDLRLTCEASADYSPLSPIEPSAAGGAKIARAIAEVAAGHDFSRRRTTVYF